MKRIDTADTIGPWHQSRARRALLIIGQIAYVARWAVAVVFIGLLVGVMAVLSSPLALAGVVALSGAFLLWALPELRLVPERSLRLFFFLMVFVQLSVPAVLCDSGARAAVDFGAPSVFEYRHRSIWHRCRWVNAGPLHLS